ncbi:MAG TPA: DedA family protein [Planctomycetota bacterium]|nr:DedA family protein [Planctomycetota bacterium]
MFDWVLDLLRLNVEFIERGGYPGIAILMAIESSIIPFPCEIIVPPAGYLAAQGKMSIGGVLAASVVGSLAGAWANYWLALRFGRPFLLRVGKWMLLKEKHLDRAEAYFARHGEIGTFVGRLVPGVRSFVSLPAGMARMDPFRFSLYTGLGAGIWCAILVAVGWAIGKAGAELDIETVKAESGRIFLFAVLPGIAVLIGIYAWRRKKRDGDAPSSQPPSA